MKQQNGASPLSNRQRALAFREAFLAGITPEDLTAIGRTLVERAKGGDLQAARLIVERFVGPQTLGEWPTAGDVQRAEMFDSLLG
jgi:hypothetical protein